MKNFTLFLKTSLIQKKTKPMEVLPKMEAELLCLRSTVEQFDCGAKFHRGASGLSQRYR